MLVHLRLAGVVSGLHRISRLTVEARRWPIQRYAKFAGARCPPMPLLLMMYSKVLLGIRGFVFC